MSDSSSDDDIPLSDSKLRQARDRKPKKKPPPSPSSSDSDVTRGTLKNGQAEAEVQRE